jgi:hypothetical protein
MLKKLNAKEAEGLGGWDDKFYAKEFPAKLLEHVGRLLIEKTPQEIDIANFAMFLWYHRRAGRPHHPRKNS